MNNIARISRELYGYLEEIENKLLSKHINNPESGPDDYEFDVKSYCILAHSALEEYFEKIAHVILDKCIYEWYKYRNITEPLLTLVSYSRKRLVINGDNNYSDVRIFDLLRDIIEKS